MMETRRRHEGGSGAEWSRRLGWLLLAVVLTSALVTGVSGQERARQEKIRLAYPAFSVTSIPFYAAKRLGFYEAEGLSVELLNVKAALSVTATVAGSLDYTAAAGSSIDASISGIPLRIIMVGMDKSYFDLFAVPEITTFQGLKGKALAVSAFGSLSETVLAEVLRQNGVKPESEVTIMALGSSRTRLAAMRARSIVATVLPVPDNLWAQDAGFHKLAYAGDFVRTIQAGAATTLERIQRNPEQVLRFVRASLKGQRFYVARKKESVPLLMEFLDIKDPHFANRAYEAHMHSIAVEGTASNAVMQESIERAKKTLKITRPVQNGEAFDLRFVERVNAELKAKGWKP